MLVELYVGVFVIMSTVFMFVYIENLGRRIPSGIIVNIARSVISFCVVCLFVIAGYFGFLSKSQPDSCVIIQIQNNGEPAQPAQPVLPAQRTYGI